MAGVPPNKNRVYIQRARVETAAQIDSLSLRISDPVHSILESPLGPMFQGSLVLDPMFLDTTSFDQMGGMICWESMCYAGRWFWGSSNTVQIKLVWNSLWTSEFCSEMGWTPLVPCSSWNWRIRHDSLLLLTQDCPVNTFQVGSRPPGSVLKIHRQEDKWTIFLATGASNFLCFQQSNELCPMFNPGCNSSCPIILLSFLLFTQTKNAAGRSLNLF